MKFEDINLFVGVSCSEQSRFSNFWDSLIHLQFPPRTQVAICRGAVISKNRNSLADMFLQSEATHLFYADDDQIFPPETLKRLVTHDKPVISGLYLSRIFPFLPHIYDTETQNGFVGHRFFNPLDKGLIEVLASGAGCLLVKREVFEKLEKPYWTLGQIDKVEWSDDIDFLRRVRKAGYKVYVDMNCPIGHMITGTVWPEKIEGHWKATFVTRALSEDGKNMSSELPLVRFDQPESPKLIVTPDELVK